MTSSTAKLPLTICSAEDRLSSEAGARLVLHALTRAALGRSIVLSCPIFRGGQSRRAFRAFRGVLT